MIVRRLRVENFKCFEREEWIFEPGLNVLFGQNEAGKSSIREALLLAFFGNAATGSSDVRGKTRYERSRWRYGVEAAWPRRT